MDATAARAAEVAKAGRRKRVEAARNIVSGGCAGTVFEIESGNA